MSTQRESKLSREIMDALRLEGWFCFKVHGNEHMMAGLPDVMVCANGYFIALETKVPDKRNEKKPRQVYVQGLINQAGGTAAVVCSPSEAVRVVRGVIASA